MTELKSFCGLWTPPCSELLLMVIKLYGSNKSNVVRYHLNHKQIAVQV
jgi:hypothetical protein